MTESQLQLLARIEAHDFDKQALLPFTSRLAKENDWSAYRALCVLKEYRRFCFLAVVAGHPVSPSDAVDQAWHLHLIYTRDYWELWCGQVLQMSLHHGPSLGGSAEEAKFTDWYARTLESYALWFGEPAPEDVWPLPARRASAEGKHQRVDVTRNLVIPIPDWLRRSLFLKLL
jgi:hypothetical protein